MELKFPLLLDGATGTQLQKRGFGPGQCAEAWVLEHPEAIAEVQSRYAALGSQVVYAPTFGANRVNLEEHGIFGKVEEYNRRLVSISRQADDAHWVEGHVYSGMPAGSETLVSVLVGDTMLTVKELGSTHYASDEPVYLGFNPKKVNVFETKSENLIKYCV